MRVIENPEKFRSNVRNKLNELIQNENHSKNLEKGIYNWSLKESTQRKVIKKWDNLYFIEIYEEHLRSVYINLKNNPKLLETLVTEQVKAHEIAFMTHQEMKPERWTELIDKKMKLDRNKYEINMEASTDTFTCRKCKSKKCTYTQAQTRSADEPMTTFVSCINCGNRWKC
jgi:transcription elongation factor S-II